MTTDVELRNAVAILSNHTMANKPVPDDVRKLADTYGKPIWNSEEHVYKKGFDCEISLVQAFNDNFIRSGVTKIVNWYLVGSVYPMEPYPETPAAMIANSPWSGHYHTREVLWGYAHYGQFSKAGWQYLKGACGNLAGGGTFVTLKSPGKDYSVIAETKDAKTVQTLTFHVSGGLSTRKLCVWRSDATEQFVRQADINPSHGSFTIALQPMSIYSISTTTGQQKGSFADIPADQDFPFPYYETFEEYSSPGNGVTCLTTPRTSPARSKSPTARTTLENACDRSLSQRAQSWAPEWMPYTILGDQNWKDYEVAADVYLPDGGWAGVLGRVNNVGNGYGCVPKGSYLDSPRMAVAPCMRPFRRNNAGDGIQLATGTAANVAEKQWHNLKLQFSGDLIQASWTARRCCPRPTPSMRTAWPG